jgi:hypothetical protein
MNIGKLETIMNGDAYWFKNDSDRGRVDNPSQGGRNNEYARAVRKEQPAKRRDIFIPRKPRVRENNNTIKEKFRRKGNSALREQLRREGMDEYELDAILGGMNMRLLESIDYSDIINNLFASKYSAYNFLRVVQKNGWSYVIAANSPLIGSMIEKLNADVLTENVKEVLFDNLYASIAGIIASESLLSIINGFNMLYIMIAIIFALLLFLILTRKKKESEE